MKVSVNWLRLFGDLYHSSDDSMPDGIDKLVDKINAQLGAVEEVIDVGRKYDGILVVKVVTCVKHPDADKLSLCTIDDGGANNKVKRNGDGLIQVVCGAPNCRPGLQVAWIPPGATVPSTYDKDQFVLETREIRGKISNGMLASPKELALGDSHEGILEIEEETKPGTPFAELYKLDDYIIDIENKMFTHRPDLFGMLGIAREVAGIQHEAFSSPDWYVQDAPIIEPGGSRLKLGIKNEIPRQVPRFCAVVVKDVQIKPSATRHQTWLSRIGIKTINNIVDFTNFYMMETGQPIHVYDYDKVAELCGGKDAELTVRHAETGETITVLGGKNIKLHKDDMVVYAGNQPVCVGGVIGGLAAEVNKDTKNVIIEAANWDMNVIRKTSMRHGLFTEATTRFTKDQSPLQNRAVIAKMVEHIERLGYGKVASAFIDNNHLKQKLRSIMISPDFINQRLGVELSGDEIARLLRNVEFDVGFEMDELEVKTPFWRTDIEIPEDVVEEVGRLYGYDHLPRELPRRELTPASKNPQIAFKDRLRDILARAGANEVLTYSFVDGSLINKAGQDIKDGYHIRNAISPDLQYYRLSLAPSLLDKVHPNIKLGFGQFALFELGRVHIKKELDKEGLPAELQRLSVVINPDPKQKGAAFFMARYYTEQIIKMLSISGAEYLPLSKAKLSRSWRIASSAFDPDRSAAVIVDGQLLGVLGEPSAKLQTSLKLPARISMVELDVTGLRELSTPLAYRPLNKFPSLEQDFCLRTGTEVSYGMLNKFMADSLTRLAEAQGYKYEIEPLDIFQPEGEDYKQTTWRINLSHPDRTLTTKESNNLLDKLATEAKKQLNAERI